MIKTYRVSFAGHVIAGHAVVMATSRAHALEVLLKALPEELRDDNVHGGKDQLKASDFKEFNTHMTHAVILSDGDY